MILLKICATALLLLGAAFNVFVAGHIALRLSDKDVRMMDRAALFFACLAVTMAALVECRRIWS